MRNIFQFWKLAKQAKYLCESKWGEKNKKKLPIESAEIFKPEVKFIPMVNAPFLLTTSKTKIEKLRAASATETESENQLKLRCGKVWLFLL